MTDEIEWKTFDTAPKDGSVIRVRRRKGGNPDGKWIYDVAVWVEKGRWGSLFYAVNEDLPFTYGFEWTRRYAAPDVVEKMADALASVNAAFKIIADELDLDLEGTTVTVSKKPSGEKIASVTMAQVVANADAALAAYKASKERA